jgi:D-amino peptidase
MTIKIYIMTDMEGISGVREPSQCDREHTEWQPARRLLVGDVNAAVAGAFDGGADEVLVSDGHGGGFNFLLEEMDPRAEYERPNGARDYLPGLDKTFSGVFQVGAHAKAGTLGGFLDHTQSSVHWFEYAINGESCGEIGQVGAIAGHYGVPVLLVTGDRAACDEARTLFGAIETAAVKKAIARNRARCLHPERSRELIRQAAQGAVGLIGSIEPWRLKAPIEVTLTYTRQDYADQVANNPGVERLDARTVRKMVDRGVDVLGF